MQRDPHSRKGQNGIVTVIGGSHRIHGAPLFAALAAEASGVDLIYPCIPECHAEVAKQSSLNFIVHPFHGDDLSTHDISALEDTIAKSSAVVLGPGLAIYETSQEALRELIRDSKVPMIIDAGALQSWTFDLLKGKQAIVTPHIGELSRMQGQVLEKKSYEEKRDLVCTIARARDITVILKGPVDVISSGDGTCSEIRGGNAGLTVGGTGDALSGLIAGLIAQNIKPLDACIMAATIIKRAATELFSEKGYALTTMDVIREIPKLLHTYEK